MTYKNESLKRSEIKKTKKAGLKQKRRKFFLVLLCFLFFICAIYVTDMATSKMLQKNDNKHAVYMKIDEGVIRLDIAGKTIELYIKPVLDLAKNIYHQWR